MRHNRLSAPLWGGATAALLFLCPAPSACARKRAPTVTLSANDNIYFALKHRHGGHLFEQGTAYGQLPGRAEGRFLLGRTFKVSATLRSGGLLFLVGSATRNRGRWPYESFVGRGQAKGGKGRFAGAHGVLFYYGTIDRRNWAVVLQVRGALTT